MKMRNNQEQKKQPKRQQPLVDFQTIYPKQPKVTHEPKPETAQKSNLERQRQRVFEKLARPGDTKALEDYITSKEEIRKIPLDRIKQVNRDLSRFNFCIENQPGLQFTGSMDISTGNQYITIGTTKNEPVAELFWAENIGFGRKCNSNHWFNVHGPFPNYLKHSIQLLKDGKIVSSRQNEQSWILSMQTDYKDILEMLEDLFREIKGESAQKPGSQKFLTTLKQYFEALEVYVQMKISQDNLLIQEVKIDTFAEDIHSELLITFHPSHEAIPTAPTEAHQRADPSRLIPIEMLALELPLIGGWSPQENNHGPWAQAAIDLIALKDKTKKEYAEIYHKTWAKKPYTEQYVRTLEKAGKDRNPDPKIHHPIVLGAVFEDCTGWTDPKTKKELAMPSFYDDWFANDPNYLKNASYYYNQPYWRDYHHYGGEGLGVKYHWYYQLRGCPSTTKPDNRYYSARDWGYGGNRINASLNRLTFTEAIKQYNRYSFEGKRNAYLMLGHVVHLLQDVANPDHAKLVPHPASGMHEVEANDRLYICIVLSAEIAGVILGPDILPDILAGNIPGLIAKIIAQSPILIVAGIVFGIAYGACKSSLDSTEKGYEKLIADDWNLSWIQSAINTQGILTKDDYDAYFKEISSYSKKIVDQKGLSLPLGCGKLPAIPPIKGCDPDIDSTDASETKPYFELTNEIIKPLISYSAGLIQDFYEIVNHPPFVEQVLVAKGVSGLTPTGFGTFKKAQFETGCSKVQVRYDAKWEMVDAKSRKLVVTKNKPLSPDHAAYVFIAFGPNIKPSNSKKMQQSTLKLKLTGTTPKNTPINMLVPLQSGYDNNIGYYYWGSFNPKNDGQTNYKLSLQIHGYDTTAHYQKRIPSGAELDSNPQTIALVNADNAPKYPFSGYEPAVDKHHTVKIGVPMVEDSLEVNNTFESATPIQLKAAKAPLLSVFDDSGATIHKNLTLRTATDIDIFDVTYKKDKKYSPGQGPRNFGGGLFLEPIPPSLQFSVEEEFGCCMAIDVYYSSKLIYKQYCPATTIGIHAPSHSVGDQLYIAVKNPDFKLQGPLKYKFGVRYIHGGFIVKGRLLYQFWDIRKTWPIDPTHFFRGIDVIGDPPDLIIYYDVDRLIQDLEMFIPTYLEEDPSIDRSEKIIEIAHLESYLGNIAHFIGNIETAERLLLSSVEKFHDTNSLSDESNVLQNLRKIYTSLGRTAEIAHINGRLQQIHYQLTV